MRTFEVTFQSTGQNDYLAESVAVDGNNNLQFLAKDGGVLFMVNGGCWETLDMRNEDDKEEARLAAI